MRSYPGNPYDGHTLDDQLEQAEIISSVAPKTVAVDLGYRGWHDTGAEIIHRGKKLSKRQKRRLRRRSVVEAMIGHMKNEGLLDRCCLKGQIGDAIHAILCGVGHNLRMIRAYWMRVLLTLWHRLLGKRGKRHINLAGSVKLIDIVEQTTQAPRWAISCAGWTD